MMFRSRTWRWLGCLSRPSSAAPRSPRSTCLTPRSWGGSRRSSFGVSRERSCTGWVASERYGGARREEHLGAAAGPRYVASLTRPKLLRTVRIEMGGLQRGLVIGLAAGVVASRRASRGSALIGTDDRGSSSIVYRHHLMQNTRCGLPRLVGRCRGGHAWPSAEPVPRSATPETWGCLDDQAHDNAVSEPAAGTEGGSFLGHRLEHHRRHTERRRTACCLAPRPKPVRVLHAWVFLARRSPGKARRGSSQAGCDRGSNAVQADVSPGKPGLRPARSLASRRRLGPPASRCLPNRGRRPRQSCVRCDA